MDIYEILSRWHTGYTISAIAAALSVDRKTVRRYVRAAEEGGLSRETPLLERDALLERIVPLVPVKERETPARSQFDPYRDEIIELVTRTTDPLKPKTAFEVICYRHDVEASYSSFKRFMRTLDAELTGTRTTFRIEVDPGDEIQVDYGSVGLLPDPEASRQRKVYAFIGTLSHSRYKFIEFVHTQDQKSFVTSHVRMFAFFAGVTKWVTIDNLKSGVLKPDRYDPELNPLYREMAEHYGIFVDPARVRKATDKGKVERVVPLARELFRKLKTLHPQAGIAELNRFALDWCRYQNGMTVHGTTGEKPAEVFFERERSALKPLPDVPFELATWKQVAVHPDQFIQFEKQTFTVPERFVGWTLWARGTKRFVQIFDRNYRLIKRHVRTEKRRHVDWSDFPAHIQDMFDDKAVIRLLRRAERIGPGMGAYIRRVLEPHAKINLRKAQGMLGFADRYGNDAVEAAAIAALSKRRFQLDAFRRLLREPPEEEEQIPISSETAAYIRPPGYFIHTTSDRNRSGEA
jgi:transposase